MEYILERVAYSDSRIFTWNVCTNGNVFIYIHIPFDWPLVPELARGCAVAGIARFLGHGLQRYV